MACPQCGEFCHCSAAGDRAGGSTIVLIDPDPIASDAAPPRRLTLEAAAPDFYRPEIDWRAEISTCVRAHRRRRGYEEDATLDLGFAPLPLPEAATSELSPPPLPPPSRYQRIAMKRRQAQLEHGAPLEGGVVIEFPKLPVTAELFPEELAEPLPRVPRILEAEPVLPEQAPAPVVASIRLDPLSLEDAFLSADDEQELALELPLQVAPFSPRAASALIDAVLVLTGVALFGMIVLSSAKFVPQGRTGLALGAGLLLFFWGAYHYLFLVFQGTTVGMQMAQLELSNFEGCVPPRATRAARAFALVLSCISLGLGFVYSLFDEDSLGWHDRITRTYLRQS